MLAFAAKPDDLSSIPLTPMWEIGSDSYKLSSDLHTSMCVNGVCVYMHAHRKKLMLKEKRSLDVLNNGQQGWFLMSSLVVFSAPGGRRLCRLLSLHSLPVLRMIILSD